MDGRGVVIESLEDLERLLRVLRDFGVTRAHINGLEFDLVVATYPTDPPAPLINSAPVTDGAHGELAPTSEPRLASLPAEDPLFDGLGGGA